MSRFSILRWLPINLSRQSAKSKTRHRTKPQRTRPHLEVLEDRTVPASLMADFNGDGFDDLVVGAAEATNGAGLAHVIYGSSTGLMSTGSQYLNQNTLGIDPNEANDNFGLSFAAGNFDGDSYDDLAIGAPGEDAAAGAVYLVYGSASGLNLASAFRVDQEDLLGESVFSERFGFALATGDFNGDGRDDLGIGVPWAVIEDGEWDFRAGGVHVMYGSQVGLIFGGQYWTQDTPGILETAGGDELFGESLAAGDFNGDGRDDLAIGVNWERIGTLEGAGGVNVIYGSATGLSTAGNQFWSQNSTGISGGAEEYDIFGTTLAAGDFNGDGKDDLAIGVPGEDLSASTFDEGAVHVLYGSASRLTATGSQLWTEDSTGVISASANSEEFGSSLVAGDFNGDGRDELAIGADNELVGFIRAGRVHILGGTAGGLVGLNQSWDSNNFGEAQAYENFGAPLSAGDYNGDGKVDLSIGIPNLDVNGVTDAGAVRVIYGRTSGLSLTGSQLWTRWSLGYFMGTFDSFGHL